MKQSNVFSNATGWKPIRILKIKILLKQLREKKKKRLVGTKIYLTTYP